ncbi:MAG: hemerythrin domain-containing protein [Polyangiaceae bacterium]|nr:hemerythrin domain-containing protein [Polyangiaceae bacterium]
MRRFRARVHAVRKVEVAFRLRRPALDDSPEARRLLDDASMLADAATPELSVRDRFLADHRRLEEILERLIAAFEAEDSEGINALLTEFDTGMAAHLEEEEKSLFPALQQTSPRDARALMQEHRHLRTRLSELSAGIDSHVVGLQVARDLIEELRAHARNEERVLYPMFATESETMLSGRRERTEARAGASTGPEQP